ncbi:MAG: pilus assembly protein PilM [Gammaproteobacteria bacterium]|nr:pilus assembly protein PilM [Gammaproteobacteria bacterium]
MTGKKSIPGLTGIDLQREGVSIARVVREPGRRPAVTLCDFRPWDGTDDRLQLIERIAADFELGQTRCTTPLAEGEYAMLLTEAPDVAPDELKRAIRWRVKDLIDFHINDATLDVFDVPGDNVPGRARAMYAVAARNDAIQQRVDLLDAAGINLDVIDIAEMAQRNLASLLPEDANGVVMLALNANSGLITITKQGEIYLSRNIDMGLDVLTGHDVAGYFDRIVLEVQRSLDYYDSHFRQSPIGKLFLAPMATTVAGMAEHLNANLDLEVSMMKLEELLGYDVQIPAPLEARCLTAIGAALRQETTAL